MAICFHTEPRFSTGVRVPHTETMMTTPRKGCLAIVKRT